MFLQATVDIRPQLETRNAPLELNTFFNAVFTTAIIFGILAVFFYFIWGGYEWLTAGGDKAKVDSARQRFFNALIGLAILATAWVLFEIIDKFFGIGITGGGGGPDAFGPPSTDPGTPG